jgi:hypothetical protein
MDEDRASGMIIGKGNLPHHMFHMHCPGIYREPSRREQGPQRLMQIKRSFRVWGLRVKFSRNVRNKPTYLTTKIIALNPNDIYDSRVA